MKALHRSLGCNETWHAAAAGCGVGARVGYGIAVFHLIIHSSWPGRGRFTDILYFSQLLGAGRINLYNTFIPSLEEEFEVMPVKNSWQELVLHYVNATSTCRASHEGHAEHVISSGMSPLHLHLPSFIGRDLKYTITIAFPPRQSRCPEPVCPYLPRSSPLNPPLTSVRSIGLRNVRQASSCTIDQVGLEDAKVRVALDPRLGVHPRHDLLEEGDLVRLAVLQHELGDPDGLAAGPRVRLGHVVLEHRRAGVVVPVHRQEVDLAPDADRHERVQPAQPDVRQHAVPGVGHCRPAQAHLAGERLHVCLVPRGSHARDGVSLRPEVGLVVREDIFGGLGGGDPGRVRGRRDAPEHGDEFE
jgi:hypothetical protein